MVRTALLLALLLAGCGDGPPCDLRRCDIRAIDCQEMAARAAACLLGAPERKIPVSLISRRQLTDAAVTGITPAARLHEQRRLAALSLIYLAAPGATPEMAARDYAARVGAYYDVEAKRITIVTDGEGAEHALDDVFHVSVLVHEFTHALQDAAGRLAFPWVDGDTSYDRLMARGVLVEGEASLAETLTTLGLFERAVDDVPWPGLFSRLHALSAQAGAASLVPHDFAYSYFAYPFGLSTVHRWYAKHGTAGLAALWAAPPISTRQVMLAIDGNRPHDPASGWLLEELGPWSVPRLPDLLEHDRVGAFVFQLFLMRAERERAIATGARWRSRAAELARELRGDYLSLFHGTSFGSSPLAVWRLRFADDPFAAEVASYVAALARPSMNVFTAGRDVVLVARRPESPPVQVTHWQFPPPPAPVPPAARAFATGTRIATCPRHDPIVGP